MRYSELEHDLATKILLDLGPNSASQIAVIHFGKGSVVLRKISITITVDAASKDAGFRTPEIAVHLMPVEWQDLCRCQVQLSEHQKFWYLMREVVGSSNALDSVVDIAFVETEARIWLHAVAHVANSDGARMVWANLFVKVSAQSRLFEVFSLEKTKGACTGQEMGLLWKCVDCYGQPFYALLDMHDGIAVSYMLKLKSVSQSNQAFLRTVKIIP